MMTGSPCPEAPTDVWATARIIVPDRVPRFFGQFRDLTMRKISMFKWVALPDAQEKISAMLDGKVIRYTRDEYIDLSESQHHTVELEPSKQQKQMITEMRKAAVTMYEENTVGRGCEAGRAGCLHPDPASRLHGCVDGEQVVSRKGEPEPAGVP